MMASSSSMVVNRVGITLVGKKLRKCEVENKFDKAGISHSLRRRHELRRSTKPSSPLWHSLYRTWQRHVLYPQPMADLLEPSQQVLYVAGGFVGIVEIVAVNPNPVLLVAAEHR